MVALLLDHSKAVNFPLVTGLGDIAYNERRNILGAISVEGKIAYHLYTFGSTKTGGIVKLARKSRWYSQDSSTKRNNE